VPQRTVFLGTSEFAAEVLRALDRSPHRPALVVTPPDRPQGRGRRLASPPVADLARELGLELCQAEQVSESPALERIRRAAPDVGAVCAFGQLIREPLLSELELLNVHPSLLPRWRGAAPIERALMAGDAATGVSIMRVTEGLDSGPVALQESLAIDPSDDGGSLSRRLAALGGELLIRALDARESGELAWRDQDESRMTYAEKIASTERRLDPSRPAAELAVLVRALHPHIGAYVGLGDGERLGVQAATPIEGTVDEGRLAERGGELLLGTAAGVLRLDEVQPPGGRPMSAEAYLRGHGLPGRTR
jgi:methionyl-tRNA formyltransferase